MSDSTAPPAKCYIITGTELDHHTDRKGRMKLPTKQAYSTIKEANTAAFTHLISRYDSAMVSGTEPGGEPDFQNAESEMELFVGSFTPLTRNVYEYVVRVKEFKMNYPRVPKQRGGKKAAAVLADGEAGEQATGRLARGNAGTGIPVPPTTAQSITSAHRPPAGPSGTSSAPLHMPPSQAKQRPTAPQAAVTPIHRVAFPQQPLAETSAQRVHPSTVTSKRSHVIDRGEDGDVVVIEDEEVAPAKKKQKKLEVNSDGWPALDELSAEDIASMFTH